MAYCDAKKINSNLKPTCHSYLNFDLYSSDSSWEVDESHETRKSQHVPYPRPETDATMSINASQSFLTCDSNRTHKCKLAYLQRNKYGPAHGSFTHSSMLPVIRRLQTFRPNTYFQNTFEILLPAALPISTSTWKLWLSCQSQCRPSCLPYAIGKSCLCLESFMTRAGIREYSSGHLSWCWRSLRDMGRFAFRSRHKVSIIEWSSSVCYVSCQKFVWRNGQNIAV